MASDGRRKRLLFSLRFASKEQEAGYLEFCSKDVLFSSRVWGACVLGACVFFMISRLINCTPWAETKEELKILNVTCVWREASMPGEVPLHFKLRDLGSLRSLRGFGCGRGGNSAVRGLLPRI